MNPLFKHLIKEYHSSWEFDNGKTHECYKFTEEEIEKYTFQIIEKCAKICDKKESALTDHLLRNGTRMNPDAYYHVAGTIAASRRNAQAIRKLKTEDIYPSNAKK